MKVSFELEGAEEMKANLQKQSRAYQLAVAASLYEEGLGIDALAIRKVPVDFGRLRSTAYCAPPIIEDAEISVTVGFGTEYAVYVHERTELRHTTGEAKFLEHAFDERADGFLDRLARRIDAHIEEGTGVVALGNFPTNPGDGEKDFDHRRAIRENKRRDRAAARRAKKGRK